ncbi:MAG: phage portal protein [Blautia massiliensis (ex Durand et al. 2017)]
MKKNFIKYELSNLLAEFRTALNRAMLLESEKQMYFFDFDISELIKGDIDKRYNAYSVGIEKGFLQTDEVRKKRKYATSWYEIYQTGAPGRIV